MQVLTEQQIERREQLFFALIDELVEENYEVADDYESSDEDLYMFSILMEHFIENYQEVPLSEAASFMFKDSDINGELYFEITEAVLDESIGKFIAGARFAMKGLAAKAGQKIASMKASRAHAAARKASAKAASYAKAHSSTLKPKKGQEPKGVVGTVKSAFVKAKAEKLKSKASEKGISASKASTNLAAARSKAGSVRSAKSKLSSKIDTGISNIKKKVKGAITSGASRVGAAVGRMAA